MRICVVCSERSRYSVPDLLSFLGQARFDGEAIEAFVTDGTEAITQPYDALIYIAALADIARDSPVRTLAEQTYGHKPIVVWKRAHGAGTEFLPDAPTIPFNRKIDDVGPAILQHLEGLMSGWATEPPQARSATHGKETRLFDITNRPEIVRYVIQAQLYRIGRAADSFENAGVNVKELVAFLAHDGDIPDATTLHALDDAIVTIGHAQGVTHVGGLAQFAARMKDPVGDDPKYAWLPPDWLADRINAESDSEAQVLVQAAWLIHEFRVAAGAQVTVDAIRNYHQTTINKVVDRLILMSNGLQSSRYIEAQLLLAGLARHDLTTVMQGLSASIFGSPLGFRSWRSVTRILHVARALEFSEDPQDQHLVNNVKVWILGLVQAAAGLRGSSIFPGRALDVECFISVPWNWAEPDLVTQALFERARDEHATVRERGTAAMGIWQRAVEHSKEDDVRDALQELCDDFRSRTEPDDLKNGFNWIALTLNKAMADGKAVCTTLPECDQPWHQVVEEAAEALGAGLPDWLLPPTRALFRHALLQNSGVERRRSIDALRAAGLAGTLSNQLLALLGDRRIKTERWLRVRALFALSFVRGGLSEADRFRLLQVCQTIANDVMGGMGNNASVAELHEALFTIAEVFGVTGVEPTSVVEKARDVRAVLGRTLTDLVENGHTEPANHRLIGRAVAYLLTFTAQSGADDMSRQLLNHLSEHPTDRVTARFSTWVLKFRWGSDDELQPLLRGARFPY